MFVGLPEHAECSTCRQLSACHEERKFNEARVGRRYKEGGLMIVGEWPTRRDTQIQELLTGQDGDLLRALLEAAEIDLEEVYYTNALLAAPRDMSKTGLELVPDDLYACQPRLIKEIEQVRPRVIVTLGAYALDALTSNIIHKTRLEPIECTHCDPQTRKIGPFMVCAAAECRHRVAVPHLEAWKRKRLEHLDARCAELEADIRADDDADARAYLAKLEKEGCELEPAEGITLQKLWRARLLEENANSCPACKARWTRIQPKLIPCDTCGGKKKRQVPVVEFRREHPLTGREGAVGAVIEIPELTELSGTKYIIPTYSMQLIRMPTPKRKQKFTVGTQFAAEPCVRHLIKARELLTRDANFKLKVTHTEHTSDEDAAAMLAAYTAEPGDYTIDIETNSYDGPWEVTNITCIGFNHVDREEAFVLDTRHVGSDMNVGNVLVDAIVRFLEDPTKGKILHNRPYDHVVIRRIWGVDIVNVVNDTMISHTALYPDEEHNLAFVAHELTDAPMWKDGAVPANKRADFLHLSGYRTFNDLAVYNAKDNRITSLVDRKMRGRDGKSHGLVDFEGVRECLNVDMFMQEISVQMEIAGVPLKRSVLDKVEAEHLEEMVACLDKMREAVGIPADDDYLEARTWPLPSMDTDEGTAERLAMLRTFMEEAKKFFTPSGKQLMWALFDTEACGLPVLARTAKTSAPSTDREALSKHAGHPFVDALIKYNKLGYALSHYVNSEGLKLGPDGRLHAQWKITGSRTGRWTSEPSLLNWPKTMRSAVVAPPGRKFVGGDQAQLEMRIMASLSGDANLIHKCATADEKDKLNPDCDPHSFVASLVFGKTYTDLDRNDPKHYKAAPGQKKCKCQRCQRDALRDIVKRVVYGLNYGAGAATVLEAIYDGGYDGDPLTVQFIERVTGIYFKAFPGVPIWRDRTLQTAQAEREVRSPLYRRRRIFPLGGIEPAVVYNYPIQSGGADVMARGLMRLWPRLRLLDPTADIIAQVHDAIYIECAEDKAEAVAALLEECMSFEMSLSPGAPPMPYVMKAKIGDHWQAVC